MKISARVTADVTRDKESGRYRVNVGGREYEIVSAGRQAIKDYLFIRKGQKLEIEGRADGPYIRPEKCRICLKDACQPKTDRKEKTNTYDRPDTGTKEGER